MPYDRYQQVDWTGPGGQHGAAQPTVVGAHDYAPRADARARPARKAAFARIRNADDEYESDPRRGQSRDGFPGRILSSARKKTGERIKRSPVVAACSAQAWLIFRPPCACRDARRSCEYESTAA